MKLLEPVKAFWAAGCLCQDPVLDGLAGSHINLPLEILASCILEG